MLLRNAAERPQRVLQALGKRHEALATEHHARMLEAGEREAEVVEPVSERTAGYDHPEIAHVGEVGQPHAPRWMLLAEDHVLLGAVERAPVPNAPLQRPAHAFTQLWMTPDHLAEHGHGADARRGLQHR